MPLYIPAVLPVTCPSLYSPSLLSLSPPLLPRVLNPLSPLSRPVSPYEARDYYVLRERREAYALFVVGIVVVITLSFYGKRAEEFSSYGHLDDCVLQTCVFFYSFRRVEIVILFRIFSLHFFQTFVTTAKLDGRLPRLVFLS